MRLPVTRIILFISLLVPFTVSANFDEYVRAFKKADVLYEQANWDEAFYLYKELAKKSLLGEIGISYMNTRGEAGPVKRGFLSYGEWEKEYHNAKKAKFMISKNLDVDDKTLQFYYAFLLDEKYISAIPNKKLFSGHDLEQERIKKALELYRKSAKQGYPKAMHALGSIYDKGEFNVKKNIKTSLSWYRKAANKGLAKSMVRMGYAYHYGDGVQKDYKKAFYWYQKAANKGWPLAMNNLGALYLGGKGVKKNTNKAISLYKAAAKMHEDTSMENIANAYYYGESVKRDYALARRWYEKAAEYKNVYSMYQLGKIYNYGYGVKKDMKKGNEWFGKASREGHVDATYLYAEYYDLAGNRQYACDNFRKAANKGHKRAKAAVKNKCATYQKSKEEDDDFYFY